ncbi:MAG TPA: hypothetical protein VGM80_09265 [Gaiellaceae bacterium]
MTLLAAWVLFPAVALVLCLGCGLLLEVVTGRVIPGTLLAPAGFAGVIALASLTTMWPAAAKATAPVVVAVAVAGFGLGFRRRRIDAPAVMAAFGVFAVYAAPIVLSGSATFSGYVTLDDTSTWLALTDNALQHGRSLAGLQPSTYRTVLNDYFEAGYPLGAYLPLGIGHVLTRQDSAWLFQPEIAFVASMLSLPIYTVARRLVRSQLLCAIAAFVSAQAALLYGYAFWTGIKEVTAAALVALAVALVASLPGAQTRLRDAIPLAVVGAAVLDTLAIVGIVWFGAFGVVALGFLCSKHRRQAAILLAGILAAGAALAVPALTQAKGFLHTATAGDITSSGAAGLGNLVHPLSYLEVLGIWPTGDFRTRPQSMTLTYVLLAMLLLAGIAALTIAVRRREWGVPLLLAVPGAGALAVVVLGRLGHGSPWLDGKALGTASPAVLACGVIGCAALVERRKWVVPGALAGVVVAAGVLWSNGLAYANVWLAPRAQLAELQSIGSRDSGDGPALMTDYQPYGVRHFLRTLDAEGASERRVNPIPLRTGALLDKGAYADIDAFELGAVLYYRTLVLRGSPAASRPPSAYESVTAGRYYEVWQRTAAPATILEHLSLGTATEPDSLAPCADVERLASLASAHDGTLIASERPDAIIANLATIPHPPQWSVSPGGLLIPNGGGSFTVPIDVRAPGPYQVWLGGSFRDTVKITIDGSSVGSQTDQLSQSGQLVPFGSALLAKGPHTVRITYSRDRLRPGRGGYSFGLGPLELGEPATQARLRVVAPGAARSLCGKSLDWVEAVTQQ